MIADFRILLSGYKSEYDNPFGYQRSVLNMRAFVCSLSLVPKQVVRYRNLDTSIFHFRLWT
jgi:hypothetical protein